MERIGIAASKMAKGNLWLYNSYVILISFLFSLFIFSLVGSSIALALIVIGYLVNGLVPNDIQQDWWKVIRLCMVCLTVIVCVLNLFAILRNIKLTLPRDQG